MVCMLLSRIQSNCTLLQSDVDRYLDSAVDEIIRWATPVLHFVERQPELLGTEIEQGSRVVMWYISANRDETVFDDPLF